ncbi:hypothetical protein CA264_14250 [Pontibacter actiniarum]|uniref:Uncharacterized protein n=2 Tax=Pontibacter actiniarum TaxID=323450 RepID=A0A1X9YY55_9BACT|nr:hypothetical protein CA264_14250 [Pontibacter actiniarum]
MNLTATTRAKRLFEEIPSASGVAHVQNAFYVVGDDSPFLYQLNEEYQLVQRHALFDSSGVVNGRIPKAAKPDLESMTHFSYGRDELLLLLGSGASEARNKAYLVNLTDDMAVQELDLSRFYTFVKRVLRIENEGVLNIEGLAMDDVYTYLLQRPAGAGSNILIRMDTDDFKQFVLSKGDIPAAAVYYFKLPVLGQSPAGFSGAYTLDDKLFFTASVEDTPNAIDDGEVLGSFIGVIDLNALPYATDELNPLEVPATKLQNPDGSAYIGKAESLVVNRLEEGQYRVVVLSDDDAGHSELLEVQLGVTEQL